MAKKQVAAVVKIQIPAGQASPAPPVGTALGPHGVYGIQYAAAVVTRIAVGRSPDPIGGAVRLVAGNANGVQSARK